MMNVAFRLDALESVPDNAPVGWAGAAARFALDDRAGPPPDQGFGAGL